MELKLWQTYASLKVPNNFQTENYSVVSSLGVIRRPNFFFLKYYFYHIKAGLICLLHIKNISQILRIHRQHCIFHANLK